MATRNGRSTRQVSHVLGLVCLCVIAAPAWVRGEGSISFNGSSSSGTSKLQHTSANLTDGSGQMTICVWVYPDGLGEANKGVIAALDEDSNGIRIEHDDANKLAVRANWSTADGWWTFPVTDDAWNAVAITYDNSATTNDPAARVNYATATVDEEDTPSGTAASANTGYCIGNLADQSRTWEGRIAHVQIFNRILSAAEMDACLRAPGSVKHGLKLWLPMRNATDLADSSGNGFNGTATDLTTGSDSPVYDSLYQFGVVSETLGQIVIPNSGHRGVRGLGPETTKLTADSGVADRFITTAGWDTTPADSVTIAGLTLDGNKISTDSHPFTGYPMSGEWAQSVVADGIEVFAHRMRITDCRIRGFRGNGATMKRPAPDEPDWGVFEQIDNCLIAQNFIGVYVTSSDQRVLQNMIANSRDAGIRIAQDAGAVQTANNHVYGAYRAYENLGGIGCNHVNDYYADAYYGIYLDYDANENHFTNCMVQHCWRESVFIGGARNSFSNCRFECAQSGNGFTNAVGIKLDHTADYTRFTGCQFGVNYWTNPEDTPAANALAAIYLYLDEGESYAGHSLEGVNISGTAYTISTRTGDVLLKIVSTSDAVKSLTVDLDVEGFNDTDDKLLVVDSDTYFRNCSLVFRGNFGGNIDSGGKTLGDLFDLPTAWGTTYNNSITVYDTYDGDVHELDMSMTY